MESIPKIKKTITRRKNEQLIVDDVYLFNLQKTNKDKSKYYKCVEYKTLSKFSAYIKLNDKDEIIKYDNKHNHNAHEIKTFQEEGRKILYIEIKNSLEPFSIKIPKLYNSYSADKGIKSPVYSSIISTLYNDISKKFPKDILSFETAPDESIYYNTLSNTKFLLYKDNNVIIFQSENLAKIQAKHCEVIFCDSTFYSSPAIAYQIIYHKDFR